MRQLLNLSFGPVQPFIEAARRTRDLSQGSAMLLAAVQAAGRALQARHAAQILIPAVDDDTEEAWSRAAAANVLLAVLPVGGAAEAVRTAREAALAELEGWLDRAVRSRQVEIDVELGRAQIRALLEVFAGWAALPSDDAFAEARRTSARLLAASKAVRFRTPCPSGETARPKSPLLPQFESVLPVGDGFRLGRRYTERLLLDPRETLDGPSFAKRFAEQAPFASMRAVAGRGLYRAYADTEEGRALADLARRCSEEGLLAGQRFYAEELLYPVDAVPSTEADRAFLADAARARRGFLKAHNREMAARGYLAVLHADGDHMGRALSVLKTPDEVRDFSRSLAGFSRRAREIVDRHAAVGEADGDRRSTCVFAGGDDVLALLPLESAVDAAAELADAFRETMGAFDPGPDRPLTLSVGLAIVHHNSRLADAVAYSVELEHRAKAAGRSRIAIGARVRSGSDIEVVVPWDGNPAGQFREILDLYSSGTAPRGFAQDVAALASDFEDLVPVGAGIPLDHRHAEYERLCGKKTHANLERIVALRPDDGDYTRLGQVLRLVHFVSRPGGDLE